jgi:hypothetical protein
MPPGRFKSASPRGDACGCRGDFSKDFVPLHFDMVPDSNFKFKAPLPLAKIDPKISASGCLKLQRNVFYSATNSGVPNIVSYYTETGCLRLVISRTQQVYPKCCIWPHVC